MIGIGAYTSAILTKRFGVDVELAIPIAVVVTMLGGLVVLLPALRIKGSYFAPSHLGVYGTDVSTCPSYPPRPNRGTHDVRNVRYSNPDTWGGEWVYLSSVLMVIVAIAAWLLMRTRLGTALAAVGLGRMMREAVFQPQNSKWWRF